MKYLIGMASNVRVGQEFDDPEEAAAYWLENLGDRRLRLFVLRGDGKASIPTPKEARPVYEALDALSTESAPGDEA